MLLREEIRRPLRAYHAQVRRRRQGDEEFMTRPAATERIPRTMKGDGTSLRLARYRHRIVGTEPFVYYAFRKR